MSSIFYCFSRLFCCCWNESRRRAVSKVEPVKPACSMNFSDPKNEPRLTPPEGFQYFYPYGTVFPGEEQESGKSQENDKQATNHENDSNQQSTHEENVFKNSDDHH